MTTTDAGTTNVIQIEVLVPVAVADQDRARFEQAMVDFLFGSDQVRPELREELARAGVDLNSLAALCLPARLGVCPTAGALEFVPSEKLMTVCKRHGIDLAAGGAVMVAFDYDAYASKPKPPDRLEVNLLVPDAVTDVVADSAELTADISEALFGDCTLPPAAQAYLRAYGVDLADVAARSVDRLGGPDVPFTSRVSPLVHRYLTEKGFNVDQYGRFEVSRVGRAGLPDGGLMWEKATCC
ncbi:hypothetical protein [Micromonospora sp. IBSANI012]|uniref:hypothetical protein n=1 Tax=Micromonospora sp. IBSANI012 TaxID=3457761 RepID=UPI00405A2651